jgi:hypothetical protein
MYLQEPDSVVETLSDADLRTRLGRTDWKNDPAFVPDEQVFRLFQRALAAGNKVREGVLINVLSRRILSHAKAFIKRSGIYPSIIGDLDQAAEELSQYVWECLITRPGDVAHAEKRFGQLFKRRALDFQTRLLAKKRACQDSLDALDHTSGDENPEMTIRMVSALQQDATPFDSLATKQEHAQTAARLQAILTKSEFTAYVMLYVEEMQVKEVAAAKQAAVKLRSNSGQR